jgi:hypothetical protein
MAVVGNDIAALDRRLETLGYQREMPAPIGIQSSTRVVYFHRNELRRFCLDELSKAAAPSPRETWQKAKARGPRPPRSALAQRHGAADRQEPQTLAEAERCQIGRFL